MWSALFVALVVGAPPKTLVVYPPKTQPALSALSRHVLESLVLSLENLEGLEVKSEGELQLFASRLSKGPCLANPQSEDCHQKFRALAKVDHLVLSALGQLGPQLVLSVSLIDAKEETHVRQISVLAKDLKTLTERLAPAVRVLMSKRRTADKQAFSCRNTACKAALYPLEGYGVRKGLPKTLTALLLTDLRRLETFEVLSEGELEVMTRFRRKQLEVMRQKNLTALLDHLQEAGSAEYLIVGAVGKLSDAFILHLKLLNIKTQKVERRIVESYRGPEENLSKALRFAVHGLLGSPLRGEGSVLVELSENADEGSMRLSQTTTIALPQREPLSGVSVQKHALVVDVPGYYKIDQEVYVLPDAISRFHAQLRPLPTPWYKSWWFWTTTAVVIAGATAGTTAYLLLDEPNEGRADLFVETNR